MTQTIKPENWQEIWDDEAVAFLKPLIAEIQFAFIERDMIALIQLWQPGHNPKGSFISLGAQTLEGSCPLFAFGFFYETALRWPKDYVDHMADKAAVVYTNYLNWDGKGETPWKDGVHDDSVLIANADATAKVMRPRVNGVRKTATAIRPTQQGDQFDYDVKNLDTALQAEKDPWDFTEAEEVDVLS